MDRTGRITVGHIAIGNTPANPGGWEGRFQACATMFKGPQSSNLASKLSSRQANKLACAPPAISRFQRAPIVATVTLRFAEVPLNVSAFVPAASWNARKPAKIGYGSKLVQSPSLSATLKWLRESPVKSGSSAHRELAGVAPGCSPKGAPIWHTWSSLATLLPVRNGSDAVRRFARSRQLACDFVGCNHHR
jgi:hypothetical protein